MTRGADGKPMTPGGVLPGVLAAVLFGWLFWQPASGLLSSWVSGGGIDQGLLLAPLGLFLLWSRGLAPDRQPQRVVGSAILIAGVLTRLIAEAAADHYTSRMSIVVVLIGFAVFSYGFRQLRFSWLPLTLLLIAIPLPNPVWTTIGLPLQRGAAAVAGGLLHMRGIPVEVSDIIIRMPDRLVLVTEACSGVRSMITMGTLALILTQSLVHSRVTSALIIASMVPVGFLLNCLRVFATAFLVFFVDPRWGEGNAHLAIGWIAFVLQFAILYMTVSLVERFEVRPSVATGAA